MAPTNWQAATIVKISPETPGPTPGPQLVSRHDGSNPADRGHRLVAQSTEDSAFTNIY